MFKFALESNQIEVWLLKKYVDDVVIVATTLKLELIIRDGKVIWSQQAANEDTLQDTQWGASPQI